MPPQQPQRPQQPQPPLLPLLPLEQVVDNIFQDLKYRIDHFHVEANHAMAYRDSKTLLRLRKACKEAKLFIDGHVALKFYLFYLYSFVSGSSSTPTRFRDGLFGVNLLSGQFGNGPADHTLFDHLPVQRVVLDRMLQAKTLSGPTWTAEKIDQHCCRYIPRDLPSSVGPRVAVLVGRARFVSQRLRLVNPAIFSCCSVCGLPHVPQATVFPRSASGPGAESDSDDDDGGDDDGGGDGGGGQSQSGQGAIQHVQPPRTSYWKLCHPGTPHVLADAIVCSLECDLQVKTEIGEAFPVNFERLSFEEDCSLVKKTGLDRVMALNAHVFKRNRNVARLLRHTKRTQRKHSTLSPSSFAQLRNDIVKTLNIDTAIVVAASLVAASKTLSRRRPLPGGIQWRDHCWRRALTIAKHRYNTYKLRKTQHAKLKKLLPPDDAIATDEMNLPTWMQAVADDALRLFPVVPPP